jgi:membrane associated rhomboid family serine protease
MRYPSGPSTFQRDSMAAPPGVKWLLIVNVAVFIVYYFLTLGGQGRLFAPFQLVPEDTVERLFVWQPFTWLFLHDPRGFGHILFNMLSLYMFGKTLEDAWGTERFLRYYVACGVGSALCVIVAGYATGTPQVPTIGASGAIFGLLFAFGYLFPDATVLFSFLFPIKAKYMVMIIGAITFLSLPQGGVVSHIAHLGGMVVGFFMLRNAAAQRWIRGDNSRISRPSLWARAEGWYRDYKLRRARKKFQVYMSKQNRKDDPYVH